MSYEKYFKDVSGLKKVDVYRVLSLFGVTDHALGHAAKKILLCGVRTGGKGVEQEIKEARDTLSRWLEMREEDKVSVEWPCDDRIDVIGQNGNDGAVYDRQYRDLEKPWEWQLGDIAEVTSDGEVVTSTIFSIDDGVDGKLVFQLAGINKWISPESFNSVIYKP